MAKKQKKNMTLKEKIIDNIQVFFSAYAIAFVIRLFLIEAYKIPSQSMVPGLLVNDILMVEKVTMGPRVPVLNIKIPGVIKPQRNDIVVFFHPAWENPGLAQELVSVLTLYIINLDNNFDNPKNLVKRLIGIPGDRVMMTNQILVVNGEPQTRKFIMNAQEVEYNMMTKVGVGNYDIYAEKAGGKTRIVQQAASKRLVLPSETADFEEIVVPAAGQVISLTNQNPYYLGLLQLLVERESGKKLQKGLDGKLFMDGKPLNEWKVQKNYYFCMGDNRDMSLDCRYFGFVAQDRIFGRPLFRYWPIPRFGFDVNETEKGILKNNSL